VDRSTTLLPEDVRGIDASPELDPLTWANWTPLGAPGPRWGLRLQTPFAGSACCSPHRPGDAAVHVGPVILPLLDL